MKNALIILTIILAAAALLLSGFTIDDNTSKITHSKNIKNVTIKILAAGNKTKSKNMIGRTTQFTAPRGLCSTCEKTPLSHEVLHVTRKYDAWSKGTFF